MSDFSPYRYMKIGLIHFMAFPETIKGEGPILETLTKIAADDFFTAVEISWIKDPELRKKVRNILEVSHLTLAYGAQPRLLLNKLNLNSLNKEERERAIQEVREGMDEARYLRARGIAVLSGPDPGKERREEATEALIDSLKELSRYAEARELKLVLETFDRDIDKKCLIGPSSEAVRVAKQVRKEYKNFGLMVDLSHFPLQGEKTRKALSRVRRFLTHVHLGNCVMKDRQNPAYGDQHPRFGIPGGENDIEEVREFLQTLFDIGFLREDRKELPLVSFEVKPLEGETSDMVIANVKRVFREAWAQVKIPM